MAVCSEDSFKEAMSHTESMQVGELRQKYVNTRHQKVAYKMYDYTCDVKLVVGKEKFKAHRHVLVEASDYFAAMFGHDMKEKEQPAIELHDIGPQGFAAMMDYFYHGYLTLDPTNIDQVIEAGRFFHIDWLIHISCDYLIRFLSIENYDVVLELVDRYCLGDLRHDIFSFISKNFVDLAQQPLFLKLSYELLHLLMSEDHYIEANEAFILKKVISWLDHSPEEREQYREKLLHLIRYQLIEHNELENIPTEVTDTPGIAKLVEDARSYQADPTSQCLKSSSMSNVRGAHDMLALYSGVDHASVVHYKVPDLRGFFSEAVDTSFMDLVFEFSSVAVLGNFLFVAGGYNSDNWCSSSSFYCYNPRNRLWAQLSSMKQARVSFPLVSSEAGLYAVMGIDHIVSHGRDEENILNTIELYNPVTNLWEIITPLPVGSFSSGAAVVGDSLYITGGITEDPQDNVPVNYMYMYSTKDNSWSTMPGMAVERHSHAMVALENKLYVFGGYTSEQLNMRFTYCFENEVFDLETNQWSMITATPNSFGRLCPTAAVIGGSIYLLGSTLGQHFLHEYHTEKDELDEGILCGDDVLKLVCLQVAFPLDILSLDEDSS